MALSIHVWERKYTGFLFITNHHLVLLIQIFSQYFSAILLPVLCLVWEHFVCTSLDLDGSLPLLHGRETVNGFVLLQNLHLVLLNQISPYISQLIGIFSFLSSLGHLVCTLLDLDGYP